MFHDLKNLTKHAVIYGLGNVLSRAVGILLIPLYTGVLTTDVFGVYAVFEVSIQLAAGVFHFGLPSSLFRWFNVESQKREKGALLFSAFSFIVILTSCLMLPFFLFGDYFSQLVFGTAEYSACFPAAALSILLQLVSLIPLTWLRQEEKSLRYILVTLLNFTVQLLVTIYLVAGQRLGVLGILLGQLSGAFLSALLLLPGFLKELVPELRPRELGRMLKFGFPLVFSGFSSRILNMGDRVILGLLTDLHVVGIYALGYKIAALIDTLFVNSFRTAFEPLAWRKAADANARRFLARMVTYMSFTLAWLALAVGLFSRGIIHLLAKDTSYWSAADIVPLVVAGVAIKGVFSVLRMGLQFSRKTGWIAAVVAGAAMVNVGLNFILIPDMGMQGAALATLLSFALMLIAGYLLMQRFYPVVIEYRRLLLIVAAVTVLFWAGSFLNHFTLAERILSKTALLTFYPLFLLAAGFFDKDEKARMRGSWRKWRNPARWPKNLSQWSGDAK